VLDLSCNEITRATLDSSFAQLTSLRQLDLSRNRIHYLFATDLQPLRHVPLDVLNLAETELSVVDDYALCAVSENLKFLSLTGNPLDPDNLARALAGYAPESLDSSSTDHNSSSPVCGTAAFPLVRLSVGEMSIGNLTTYMLSHYQHLLVLDATFSDLVWVEPDLFNHLTRLETLHLESGRLTVVMNLSAMKNLRRIYLQQNQLTEVVTLTGLYSLVFIDLSYNRISRVPAVWLDGFRHLQAINILFCFIRHIKCFTTASVCLSRGFAVQTQLNRSKFCLKWDLGIQHIRFPISPTDSMRPLPNYFGQLLLPDAVNDIMAIVTVLFIRCVRDLNVHTTELN